MVSVVALPAFQGPRQAAIPTPASNKPKLLRQSLPPRDTYLRFEITDRHLIPIAIFTLISQLQMSSRIQSPRSARIGGVRDIVVEECDEAAAEGAGYMAVGEEGGEGYRAPRAHQ